MAGKKDGCQVKCIDDEILEKMSLKNRNKFLNNNLMSILKPVHFNFLKKVQKFYERFEKSNNITHNEDFYDWIPALGKEGLVSRVNCFKDLGFNYEPYGITTEFVRVLATDFFDPQLAIFN